LNPLFCFLNNELKKDWKFLWVKTSEKTLEEMREPSRISFFKPERKESFSFLSLLNHLRSRFDAALCREKILNSFPMVRELSNRG